jgi:hypothetical protein
MIRDHAQRVPTGLDSQPLADVSEGMDWRLRLKIGTADLWDEHIRTAGRSLLQHVSLEHHPR